MSRQVLQLPNRVTTLSEDNVARGQQSIGTATASSEATVLSSR